MQTMYPGKVNSPKALTENIIGASETTIEVSDGSVLPAVPNLAVLGSGENCETILYTVKTGNILSGITRGFQGTAQEWPAGTPIARNFTEYDHAAFKANIEELAADVGALDGRTDTAEDAIDALEGSVAALGTDKLDKTGNGSNVTATFTAAATRENIATGENLSVLLGKLAKWFADFGAAAWLNVGSGASEVAAGNHLHGSIANDGKIGSTADLPVFTGASGALGTKTVADARTALGVAASPTQLAALPTSGTALTNNAEYRVATAVGTYTFAWPASPFEVWLKFTTAATFNIAFPAGTTYIGGAPTFAASKTYEMSVKDGVVIMQEVAAA